MTTSLLSDPTAYPVLHTLEWYDPDGTMHTWRHKVERPPTPEECEQNEAALRSCGFYDAVAELVAQGKHPEDARHTVLVWMLKRLVTRSWDEAAYDRECERRGLLPL